MPLDEKKFSQFSQNSAKKVIKRAQIKENAKRNDGSRNKSCKAAAGHNTNGTESKETGTEVIVLKSILQNAVDTLHIKTKEICDKINKSYEPSISHETSEIKGQQRDLLRMSIRSDISSSKQRDTSVQDNTSGSTKKMFDKIIAEKFSNKHKVFFNGFPRYQGEEEVTRTSRSHIHTLDSELETHESIETDGGVFKHSYKLNETISTDSQKRRLDEIKNFLASPENVELLAKNDQIDYRCYHLDDDHDSNGCGDSIAAKDYSIVSLSGHNSRGVSNQSSHKENSSTSRYYSWKSSTPRSTTSAQPSPRTSVYCSCEGKHRPACVLHGTDLDIEDFYYRTSSSTSRSESTLPAICIPNSYIKKEDDLCTKSESTVKNKFENDLSEQFQTARAREREKIREEKPNTKDISKISRAKSIQLKRKEREGDSKNQKPEQHERTERQNYDDKRSEALIQRSRKSTSSRYRYAGERRKENGIRIKAECINEKNIRSDDAASPSGYTKTSNQQRICTGPTRTRSLSPVTRYSAWFKCTEYFKKELQSRETPHGTHGKNSSETLSTLQNMNINEGKPGKSKNDKKDKQYNEYVKKYETKEDKLLPTDELTLRLDTGTLGNQTNHDSSELIGYKSLVIKKPTRKPMNLPMTLTSPSSLMITKASSPKQSETSNACIECSNKPSDIQINETSRSYDYFETKTNEFTERVATVQDLNLAKIKSKECIEAKDETQITRTQQHLSVKEIFKSHIDQNNLDRTNNNGTANISPPMKDPLACIKNTLVFQNPSAKVEELEKLYGAITEVSCKGQHGNEVKIIKNAETKYEESQICNIDTSSYTSTTQYTDPTKIPIKSCTNIEDLPQCSKDNAENKENNMQTSLAHNQDTFDCNDEKNIDLKVQRSSVYCEQRSKQLLHFPPPPSMSFPTYEDEYYRLPSRDTSLAYYEPIPKTKSVNKRATLGDTSACLSPQFKKVVNLDHTGHDTSSEAFNSNHREIEQRNRLLAGDCSCSTCTSSRIPTGFQLTTSKCTDSFRTTCDSGFCSSYAHKESRVKDDSNSSISIYKDCVSNICLPPKQIHSSSAFNNCSATNSQTPIITCSMPEFHNLNYDFYLNTSYTRHKYPSKSGCVTSAHLRKIIKSLTPNKCTSRVTTSYESCLNSFETEQCAAPLTTESPQKQLQFEISYQGSCTKNRQKILAQSERTCESSICNEQSDRSTKRIFRATSSSKATTVLCDDIDFHAEPLCHPISTMSPGKKSFRKVYNSRERSTCMRTENFSSHNPLHLDDKIPAFTHCPCMYGIYKSMLEIYYKGEDKPPGNLYRQ
uniref:Uncharacterized protein n=1 Tax=Glossina brevipalpis TaxID=37001 RepID=A0A1A9X332_9MUSC